MVTIGHLAKSEDPKLHQRTVILLQNHRQQLECENPCNKESWCAQTKCLGAKIFGSDSMVVTLTLLEGSKTSDQREHRA